MSEKNTTVHRQMTGSPRLLAALVAVRHLEAWTGESENRRLDIRFRPDGAASGADRALLQCVWGSGLSDYRVYAGCRV